MGKTKNVGEKREGSDQIIHFYASRYFLRLDFATKTETPMVSLHWQKYIELPNSVMFKKPSYKRKIEHNFSIF